MFFRICTISRFSCRLTSVCQNKIVSVKVNKAVETAQPPQSSDNCIGNLKLNAGCLQNSDIKMYKNA
jgi:hypothetical protein